MAEIRVSTPNKRNNRPKNSTPDTNGARIRGARICHPTKLSIMGRSMTQTQGQIGYLPQAFASKFAIWIADRVASRLGLLCTRVALNDERVPGNDAIVNKDRACTRFIAIDGDESALERRAQPSRAADAPAESDVAPTSATRHFKSGSDD
jgi:hypothetical protein